MLSVGQSLPVAEVTSIGGETISFKKPDQLLHVQFRRFAGCPICDLHLHSFVQRHGELTSHDIKEVVFFHSTKEELQQYESNLPFAVIADPTKAIYSKVGVEASLWGSLHPLGLIQFPYVMYKFLTGLWAGTRSMPPSDPTGGRMGMPADFLVGKDGKIVAVKYGQHPSDHWSVDEVLSLKAKTE